MPASRKCSLPLLGLVFLVQACTTTPDAEQPAAEVTASPESLPELTLNLPEQSENCLCVVGDEVDYTFLEKGFNALVAGDHIEAVQYFQQYQRLESSPQTDWEAGIAIAYDSMLPRSPFYDPEAAQQSYQDLKGRQLDGVPVHNKVLMMRDALETFVSLESRIEELESANVSLREDLAKREEAIKRLRELTLGQPEE